MHIVCLFRVLILIVAVPSLASSAGTSEWLKLIFPHEQSIRMLYEGQLLNGNRIPRESVEEWAAFGAAILALAVLWVLVTLPMVLAAAFCAAGPLSWERDAVLLGDIDGLAAKIHLAAGHNDWRVCLFKMKRLREVHPSLQLTTVITTFGPAAGTLAHLALDLSAAYTFFSHGRRHPTTRHSDFVLGSLTVINFIFTLMHNCNVGRGNPLAMIKEAKLSFERGVYTDTYIKILYGDAGAHMLVTTAINVFGLPFRADNPLKVASALMAIIITVVTCVPFIFQQFDLGTEREGFDMPQPTPLPSHLPESPCGHDLRAEALSSQTREIMQRLF